MNKCTECEYCEMLIFDHPYFGEVEKIVCLNVLDDEMAEIPEDMLFTEKTVPCYTFTKKGNGKKEDAPVLFVGGE